MRGARAAGVLLHPTSLPSRYGVGDLGPGALAFLDWLVAAEQTLWQVLPLGPIGHGNSPYGCLSAFAGSPLLISPELLAEEGWLDRDALALGADRGSARVDYAQAAGERESQLRAAWRGFQSAAAPAQRDEADGFREAEAQRSWLPDWTLFAALKQAHEGREWTAWDAELRDREPGALASARRRLADEIAFHAWVQWVFERQWRSLHRAAVARGIRLLGDVPIYVAPDSADTWAHRQLFALDDLGRPSEVAGVPPDYFSPTGQRWGNPLYRWSVLAEDGYGWWTERLRHHLALTDALRLDHFRGFAAYWAIPAGAPSAVNGRWEAGPGAALFEALHRTLGPLPLVAEDLGIITPDVLALRDRFGLPGMAVLQFGFDPESSHAPFRQRQNLVVYTGTHDNDTTRGWFESLDRTARRRVLDLLGASPETVVAAMIRTAYASVADTAVVPLQDVLGLGSEARMNTPSGTSDNWSWRVSLEQLSAEAAAPLAHLVELTERRPASDLAPSTAGAPYPDGYPGAPHAEPPGPTH